jgi:hypothetical protein
VDIVEGSTAGRDRLRAFLRAPTTIPDAELQQVWDQAVGACRHYIRDGYTTSAPEAVVAYVLAICNHVWQASRDAGGVETLPDGTTFTPYAITGNLCKRYLSLGGLYVGTPRVVAGGTAGSASQEVAYL